MRREAGQWQPCAAAAAAPPRFLPQPRRPSSCPAGEAAAPRLQAVLGWAARSTAQQAQRRRREQQRQHRMRCSRRTAVAACAALLRSRLGWAAHHQQAAAAQMQPMGAPLPQHPQQTVRLARLQGQPTGAPAPCRRSRQLLACMHLADAPAPCRSSHQPMVGAPAPCRSSHRPTVRRQCRHGRPAQEQAPGRGRVGRQEPEGRHRNRRCASL